jgi:hypothetical protein
MGVVRNIFHHSQNPIAELTSLGYVYNISQVALTTPITGVTSFATTTPSFIVVADAASGMTFVPLYFSYQQSGTVAGGTISIFMEVDNADRYTSGGTAQTVMNAWVNGTGFGNAQTTLPTGVTAFAATGTAITATDAVGIRIWSPEVGQDVAPAEGVSNELVWTPPAGGPEVLSTSATLGASWLVHAVAATTGPTFRYSAKIAVFPTSQY